MQVIFGNKAALKTPTTTPLEIEKSFLRSIIKYHREDEAINVAMATENANIHESSLEKDSMKKSQNLVTSTMGSTLSLTKLERKLLIGSTILPGGILILIFLVFVLLITRRLTKEKILKIFGNEKM